jgi:hypothetical protein
VGLIPFPDTKDFWSGEWTTQIKFLGDVMSRVSFLQLFWMLYVGNDALNRVIQSSNEQIFFEKQPVLKNCRPIPLF